MALAVGYRKPSARVNDPDLIHRVAGLVEEGLTDPQIGRMLGVDKYLVRSIRRNRLDNLPPGSHWRLSPSAVAAQLGVTEHLVLGWIRRGLLPAKQPPGRPVAGGRSHYRIDEGELLDFLADPAHWHEWRVEDVADADLREWAEALHRPRYLSVAEVADRMAVERHTVTTWIARGLLPGARTFASGRVWRIPETDLVGFEIPSEQGRVWLWRTAWKPDEDAALRAGIEALAAQIGRSPKACVERWLKVRREAKRRTGR